MHDPGSIRNRRKLVATAQNAKVAVTVFQEFGSLDTYLWSFVYGVPVVNQWKRMNQVPAASPLAVALSKDRKHRGCNFLDLPSATHSCRQDEWSMITS
jgi:DNA-3-methyladenine glycosylase I